MDAFERFVTGGLELAGMAVEELEIHIMRGAHAIYGPPIEALQQADLRDVWPEPDLDPSRAPSGR